jgi:hypothetical protein
VLTRDQLQTIDAWITITLLVLFFVFMVSGYMITKGILDRSIGFVLHTELDLVIMVMFSIHVAIRLRFVMARRQLFRNHIRLANVLTVAMIVGATGLMMFLDLIILAS